MSAPFDQAHAAVRLEWGPVGAAVVRADLAVVVDVLSFTTAVTVAVGRGSTVLPFAWRDERAAAYAAAHDAVLAVGRLEARRAGAVGAPSLSPAGLLTGPVVPRLVLPSPNGSTISALLRDAGAHVAAGCLRNASAVGRWLAPSVAAGSSVVVLAAGERWGTDGSLRPALEDQLGAGAVLAALRDETASTSTWSAEAQSATELFDAVRPRLRERLRACVGGRELAAAGFGEDVDVAADLDASEVVPVLTERGFVAAGATPMERR
ncbi:2-phosphosulfolactate phosphatase [Phycicoccus sp. MAQZ13P-2]|uniref:2-phosphosulfolactate phosphatase n=1 Tax=Phycicoccus mangrovi TaxID=2840470 RepID=UPI001C008669|nr:2-phosphosulfolactate phosphatase [Phycicoccus mangrovi]MBT9254486.1 2-phosphosulfolactate phosphatase [Phycicoccus mangrovi]MBT9273309.1 2-phosphosulfolactate phosphatase [Phycicoccus mangrovi]